MKRPLRYWIKRRLFIRNLQRICDAKGFRIAFHRDPMELRDGNDDERDFSVHTGDTVFSEYYTDYLLRMHGDTFYTVLTGGMLKRVDSLTGKEEVLLTPHEIRGVLADCPEAGIAEYYVIPDTDMVLLGVLYYEKKTRQTVQYLLLVDYAEKEVVRKTSESRRGVVRVLRFDSYTGDRILILRGGEEKGSSIRTTLSCVAYTVDGRKALPVSFGDHD